MNIFKTESFFFYKAGITEWSNETPGYSHALNDCYDNSTSPLLLQMCTSPQYLHLRHVDRFVDEYPSGGLIARWDGDGALVRDVACGVRVKVGYIQAHQ